MCDIELGDELILPTQSRINAFPDPMRHIPTWDERIALAQARLTELCQTAEEERVVPDTALREALSLILPCLPIQVAPTVRRLVDLAERYAQTSRETSR